MRARLTENVRAGRRGRAGDDAGHVERSGRGTRRVRGVGELVQHAAQRVSQAFGLGLLNAFLTVAGAQGLANRSGLLDTTDPQVAAMAQNQAELYALYQRTAGIAQADAFSSAFLVISLLCFAGAVLALCLPSGKPAGSSSAAMAH